MSKFCTSCGTPLEDGAKFCGGCGAPVVPDPIPAAAAPPVAPAPAPQPQPVAPAPAPRPQPVPASPPPQAPGQHAPKKSKKGLIIGICIAAAAVIAAVVILLFIFVFNKDDSSSDDGASSPGTTSQSEKNTEKEEAAATVDTPAADDPFHGENDIRLTVWVPNQAIDVTNELCRSFLSEHPDKTIVIDVLPQGENDAATQLLNDPSGADVFGFACDQLNNLAETGILLPVYDPYDVKSRNTEASVSAAMIDGEVYAYPETGDNGYYLVYDKSVVSDEDAKTLEGILSACRKAGRTFVMDASNGYYACMFPFTGGLSIKGLDSDGTQIFNDYDEGEVVDTIEAFAKLIHENGDVFASGDVTSIASGMAKSPRTVAAGIDGPWNAAAVADALGDDYGVAKLPTINVKGVDKQIISMHGFKLIGVNSYTQYPYAAQLLADYLTNEDAQILRAQKLSWGPSNIAASMDESVTGNPALRAILEQSQYAVPQSGVASTFWSPMGNLGNLVWKGTDITKNNIRSELRKTISAIRDE